MIKFALNHMTVPGLSATDCLDLAQSLGCVGVELRNDLTDKQLSKHPFFDNRPPRDVGQMAERRNLRLLGLSEVYGFNRWTPDIKEQTHRLIEQARLSGAESISFIPDNSADFDPGPDQLSQLTMVLSDIKPLLEGAGLIGLIEPLGFASSSLRLKRDAVDAIGAAGGEEVFRLVHDTFHHFLAEENEYFPEQTGIVHISGVEDAMIAKTDMADAHRVLVSTEDRLGNLKQISDLITAGYRGALSFEAFAPSIHADNDPAGLLRQSMEFISSTIEELT